VLSAALAQGIEEVWSEAEGADLGLPELRWIAQGLSANNREADSLWIRAKIDERFVFLPSPRDGLATITSFFPRCEILGYC